MTCGVSIRENSDHSRNFHWISGIIGLVLFFAGATTNFAAEKIRSTFREGELLVRFREKISAQSIRRAFPSVPWQSIQEFLILSDLRQKSYYLFRCRKVPTARLATLLAHDPRVEAVSLNWLRWPASRPNDPGYFHQWGMPRVGAETAWDIAPGSGSAVVAVMDTGADCRHEDLATNLWNNSGEVPGNDLDDDGNGYIDDIHGYDFAHDNDGHWDSDPQDENGHGTHVCGIIGATANNLVGISGICWQTRVMILKVFSPDGYISDAAFLDAIEYALIQKISFGVNLVAINASFGGYNADPIQQDAIAEAGRAGILLVAAAGNNAINTDNKPFYPACYPLACIISVAATAGDDNLTDFSNWGKRSVTIAAPGEAIFSTYLTGQGSEAFVQQQGRLFAVEPLENSPLTGFPGIRGLPVFCGQGAQPQDFPARLRGQVALIERGQVTFDQKVELAMAAGALAVIIYNDKPGIFLGAIHPPPSLHYPGIPAVSAARSDGLSMIQKPGQPLIMHSFSSNYTSLSGTSMATPLVTGAVALLADLFTDENSFYWKSRLMAGAKSIPTWNEMSESGLLNIPRAMQQPFHIWLQASRLQDQAWIVHKEYAEIIVLLDRRSPFFSQTSQILLQRRDESGNVRLIARLEANDLLSGCKTCLDRYLENDRRYSYWAEGLAANGAVIVRSKEKTI